MEQITLLVADDEPIVRTFIRRYVAEHGLPVSHIYEAANGQEAIDLAVAFSPDLILLDIRMPGVNGLDAASAILEKNAAACIVIVTAYDEFEYARTALRAGVSDYLLKPLDPAALALRIQRVVEARRQRSQGIQTILEKPPHPLVEKVCRCIDQHLGENLRLDDIAGFVHVSPSHCSRTFSRYAGLSISDFIALRRMAKARGLLENTCLPMTDITGSLGFSNSSYFASWFKRATGLSPLQYRLKNQAP
jgi:YesN/AraC family two-component response regulator